MEDPRQLFKIGDMVKAKIIEIKEGKIEIINNTNITEVRGDDLMKSVVFDKAYKGKKEFLLDRLFVYVGHIPLSDLAESVGVKTNIKGEIIRV